MAITENTYTGDGVTVLFPFTFEYIDPAHVIVSLNGADTTAFTFANATTIQLNAAPANGVAIRIYRTTDPDILEATFFPGSSIRAGDLNENFLQLLYLIQETTRLAQEASLGAIADGSIGTVKLTNEAVTTAKIGPSAVTTAKIADTAVTQAKIGTNVLTPRMSEVNGGPLAGFRNAIINGNFDIWQRTGATFNGVEYGPDRWFLGRTGTTRATTKQAFTLGQTDVPGEPTWFVRHVVGSVAGASNFAVMTQRIEDVRTFAGRQVTLSFYAKADIARPISVEFLQNFGTGGSPSTEVTAIGVAKRNLSASWQKITVTATIPSISGKTIGSDNNSYLAVGIWMDAGSSLNARTDSLGQQSGTFDFSEFQLEPGPVASMFEARPIGLELSLCQRYYQTGIAVNWGYGTAGGSVGGSFEFATTMRAAPTVTLTGAAQTNITSVAVIESFAGGTGFAARGVPTALGATYWQRNYTADIEL